MRVMVIIKANKDSMVSYLGIVGTLGPMLGLVGTVSGMIGAFRRLGASDEAPRASELIMPITIAVENMYGRFNHALGVGSAVPGAFLHGLEPDAVEQRPLKRRHELLGAEALDPAHHGLEKGALFTLPP